MHALFYHLFSVGGQGTYACLKGVKTAARQLHLALLSGRHVAFQQQGAIGLINGVAHREGNLTAISVAGRQLQAEGTAVYHVGTAPIHAIILGKFQFGIRRPGNYSKDRKAVAHIASRREFQGFSGNVRHLYGSGVVPLFLGRVSKAEAIVGPKSLLLLQHHLVILFYQDAHTGAGEVVAGIALDRTSHRHFTAHQVQFLQFIKIYVKTGQDIFVHREILADQIVQRQIKISSAKARGKDKRAGNRTPFVGFEHLLAHHIILRILEG